MPAPAWHKGGEQVLAFSLFRQVVVVEDNGASHPNRLRELGQSLGTAGHETSTSMEAQVLGQLPDARLDQLHELEEGSRLFVNAATALRAPVAAPRDVVGVHDLLVHIR